MLWSSSNKLLNIRTISRSGYKISCNILVEYFVTTIKKTERREHVAMLGLAFAKFCWYYVGICYEMDGFSLKMVSRYGKTEFPLFIRLIRFIWLVRLIQLSRLLRLIRFSCMLSKQRFLDYIRSIRVMQILTLIIYMIWIYIVYCAERIVLYSACVCVCACFCCIRWLMKPSWNEICIYNRTVFKIM